MEYTLPGVPPARPYNPPSPQPNAARLLVFHHHLLHVRGEHHLTAFPLHAADQGVDQSLGSPLGVVQHDTLWSTRGGGARDRERLVNPATVGTVRDYMMSRDALCSRGSSRGSGVNAVCARRFGKCGVRLVCGSPSTRTSAAATTTTTTGVRQQPKTTTTSTRRSTPIRDHVSHDGGRGPVRGQALQQEAQQVEPVPDEGVGDVELLQHVRERVLQAAREASQEPKTIKSR